MAITLKHLQSPTIEHQDGDLGCLDPVGNSQELIGNRHFEQALRQTFSQCDSFFSDATSDSPDSLSIDLQIGQAPQVLLGFREAFGDDSGECHLAFDQRASSCFDSQAQASRQREKKTSDISDRSTRSRSIALVRGRYR